MKKPKNPFSRDDYFGATEGVIYSKSSNKYVVRIWDKTRFKSLVQTDTIKEADDIFKNYKEQYRKNLDILINKNNHNAKNI